MISSTAYGTVRWLVRGFTLSVVLVLAGCVTSSASQVPEPDKNALYIPPSAYDFSENPKLKARIMSGAHGYFRFINVRFSEAVCQQFSQQLPRIPTVNLHGDAHLEQYAVTDLGRGLTDFDDSSVGPAVLDLVRFGVSLELIADAKGWRDTSALEDAFFRGYRAALDDPELAIEEPQAVKKVRDGFQRNRGKYFKWVESIMEPIADKERTDIEKALEPYVQTMCMERQGMAPSFFDIKAIGRLRMGIGSALDRKYLIRVGGETEAFDDDLVLEVKEVRDISGISCLASGQAKDPLRILLGESRIAYSPFNFLGYMRLEEKNFWVHSWVDNYRELTPAKFFNTPEDLSAIVYDIGVQLGRGHPNQIAAPLDLQLRLALKRMLDENEPRIRAQWKEMAALTTDAWKRFVADAQ